jgi:hypothetical protein
LAEPQAIAKGFFDSHVHGRAVKVGKPGERLAQELKVMKVSARAKRSKGVDDFILWD